MTASRMPVWAPACGISIGRVASAGIGTVMASPLTGSFQGPELRYSVR